MKKSIKLILMFSYMTITGVNAQVGMQTNNPNKDAVLDLNMADGASTKGLLLPKVELTALNSPLPMTANVAGMHVWNTANTGTGVNAVTPGEYYNDGAKWVRVSSSTDAVNNWQLNGNTNGALKTIGTQDNFALPFVTNNTEKMRLTPEGRLGVGTDTPLVGFHLKSSDVNNNDLMIEGVDDGATFIIKRSTTSTLPTGQSLGGLIWTDVDPAPGVAALTRINSYFRGADLSSLSFFVNRASTAQMTLNQSGFLGLGTTTPGSKLLLYNNNVSDADDDIRIQTRSNTYTPSILIDRNRDNGDNLVYNDNLGSIIFRSYLSGTISNLVYLKGAYKGDGTTKLSSLTLGTSGTDRMTIDEDGYVGIGINKPAAPLHVDGKDTRGILVNATNADFTGNIFDGTASSDGVDISNNSVRIQKGSGGSGSPLILSKGNGYTSIFMTEYFVKGTRVGSVTTTGTGVAYNTTSDMRLKENIIPTQFGLAEIMKIKVNDYNYKSDEKKNTNTGFLAQELFKIYPQAVSVGGADEKTNPWQVDYSKLIPLLVKAIQDQEEQIKILKEKIELKDKDSEIKELKDRMAKLEKAVNGLLK
ncbi:hypothetical protein HYN56_03380 [Flavobacterium crocinum]|uniref:Peptidase S74 domain-containing protein n=1 Tax=Flavobacterium crocinum TaxID=2183896 RepID=A0A2S1YGY3_9FLAO|nr:tail fiber domain-containing protein [Flavobacterium crocinum]AWK03312.1 hypothetical protein HYN56_03380 [Flavobacterium crocinum]